MNTEASKAERDFLIAGARAYLDVSDAIEEFHRQIQDEARRVVLGRIGDLARRFDQNWSAGDVRRYSEKGGDFFQLGRKLAVKELGPNYGGIYFCLKFYRDGGRNLCLATAFLSRDKKGLADSLWDCYSEGAFENSSVSHWNIFFTRLLSEDNIPDFGTYLDQAVADLISFVDNSGGLKGHLVDRPA